MNLFDGPKNMKRKIFNKFFGYMVLAITMLTIAIKIHSLLTFPAITNWNYHQLKKMNEKTDDYSFAVFGDNKNSITTFNELVKKLNKDDVIFSIDVGDLVQDGENEKFRFFINQIRNLDRPLLTVIGNHDIREDGRANYYRMFGRYYYSFPIGSAYFIILDDANEKGLDPWQMDWLEDELKKGQDYKYRFVFMHVPLYDPRKGGYKKGHSLEDLSLAKRLNELFDTYHVTMLFTSHIHAYYRGYWCKTPYIITGGAGAELGGIDPKHYFYHYILVNVSNAGVSYEIKKLKSPDFELIDRWIHDEWIYIYAFVAIHFLDLIIILGVGYVGLYIILNQNKLKVIRKGS
jgi:hypothetical protein